MVGKLYGPFDGEIVEVNSEISDDATLINKEPTPRLDSQGQAKDPRRFRPHEPGGLRRGHEKKLSEIKK